MVSYDDFLFEEFITVNSPETVTDVGLVRLISPFSRITIKVVCLH